jgi:predicted Fe-Mo cluster-binding NifX family protein
MKIAVSSTGMDLDSEIDPRFGRCAYFLIVDPNDMSFEAFENESMTLGGGAGIQSGQFIASKEAQVVITGNIGPNASKTLNAAGIDVIVGISGPIKDAIERYKKGKLSPTEGPSVSDHYGMGMSGSPTPYSGVGMGTGRGMGMSRGMGKGMGTGRGMGGGMGMQGGYTANQGQPASSPDQGLGALKEEAKALRDQLDSILSRIKDLEKK